MAQLDLLKTQRKTAKASITRIQTFVTNFDINSGNIFELSAREEQLRVNFINYSKYQTDLEVIDYDTYSLDREEVENKYYSTCAKIKLLLNTNNASVNSNSVGNISNTNNTSSGHIKLPNIHITTFNGKTDQWKTFSSLFNATIHNNSQLDNVQRFYYLKSFLKDEPLNLINELDLTSSNYVKALEILQARYDNKLVNVNYHLKMLFDITPITKGNAVSLREFVTTVNQHVNALEALALPVNTWDVLLVYLLSKKLILTRIRHLN